MNFINLSCIHYLIILKAWHMSTLNGNKLPFILELLSSNHDSNWANL